MPRLIQLATFLILITASRGLGLHGIRIVVMGVLGLAGLWMLHTLAQDFTKIYNTINPRAEGAPIRFFAKRSVVKYSPQIDHKENVKPVSEDHMELPEIDWERILARDPVGCARSFVCQLIATSDNRMSNDERAILTLIRMSSQKDNWATREVQRALKYGQSIGVPEDCRRQYRFCPYSSKMMIVLLRLLSGIGTTTTTGSIFTP